MKFSADNIEVTTNSNDEGSSREELAAHRNEREPAVTGPVL